MDDRNAVKTVTSVLAFDLGASSGRAMIGHWNGEVLSLEEIHRFPNDPVMVGEQLHWDILRLFHEIKQGILKSKQQQRNVKSIGIDSWGVDFGLLGLRGEMMENPYHYRDRRTDGVMESVSESMGKARLFARTGLQFLPFNTIYQLVAMKNEGSNTLEQCSHLLMIPDLLCYFLTGERHNEFSIASTSQLLNPVTKDWDRDLLRELGLPTSIFSDVIVPGTVAGKLQTSVCEELGVSPLPVIAVGEHDTASAVAAVPAQSADFAYLISGTWSLLGTELPHPILNPQAMEHNFTNEGGVQGTYRFLKNIMGMWLVQECKRTWDKEGESISFEELVRLAAQAEPFLCLIDPDDEMFLHPGNMPEQIAHYCQKSGQPVPQSKGQTIRCILESLALQYKKVLSLTEKLTDKTFSGLHITGGGIQNKLLCQFTANAIGKPVWAGPVEGSAIGNVLMQLITLGKIKDLAEARAAVRRSFPIETYEPSQSEDWDQAYVRFLQLLD